jgi:hypothetical protein
MYYILSIIGGFILLLLGIIGFFLKQHIVVVKDLTKSVNVLSNIVGVLENKYKNQLIGCEQKHGTLNYRIGVHGERLDNIDIEIAKIQTEIEIKLK